MVGWMLDEWRTDGWTDGQANECINIDRRMDGRNKHGESRRRKRGKGDKERVQQRRQRDEFGTQRWDESTRQYA